MNANDTKPATRHESKSQPGLFYWVEQVSPSPPAFNVVCQATGYPATEAWDDWFGKFSDADEVASKLAADEPLDAPAEAESAKDNEIAAEIEGFDAPEAPKAPEPQPAPVLEQPKAEKPPIPEIKSPELPLGALVKLVETRFGDEPKNPVWGGSQGMTGGTVQALVRAGRHEIVWDNGQHNAYSTADLRLLTDDEKRLANDNKLLPRKQEKPRSWPDDAKANREAWLLEAAHRICAKWTDLNGVLFSVGFGKGGTRGASDWAVIENKAENGWQVFVRPNVADKVPALACVVGALQKLGVRLVSREQLAGIGGDWPEYPQPDVTHAHKQQATRLIKCWCTSCGYTVRTTQRWLAGGAPLCPCANPPAVMQIAK